LAWRIYAEEALMQQEFGEEWMAYRKHSWRIIPFIF
jgi:protein-S-isoprenylcysteine O-methyltransferase Ste14